MDRDRRRGSRRPGCPSRPPRRRRLEAQPGPAQRRHLGPRQPRLRRHPPIHPAPRLRLRIRKLPQGLPRARPHQEDPRLRFAHGADHDCGRARPSRFHPLRISGRNGALDDGGQPGPPAAGHLRISRGWRGRGDQPRGRFSDRRGWGVPCRDRTRARHTSGPSSDPGHLHSPSRPHDGLRGVLRGPDHLGALGRGCLSRSRTAT